MVWKAVPDSWRIADVFKHFRVYQRPQRTCQVCHVRSTMRNTLLFPRELIFLGSQALWGTFPCCFPPVWNSAHRVLHQWSPLFQECFQVMARIRYRVIYSDRIQFLTFINHMRHFMCELFMAMAIDTTRTGNFGSAVISNSRNHYPSMVTKTLPFDVF